MPPVFLTAVIYKHFARVFTPNAWEVTGIPLPVMLGCVSFTLANGNLPGCTYLHLLQMSHHTSIGTLVCVYT